MFRKNLFFGNIEKNECLFSVDRSSLEKLTELRGLSSAATLARSLARPSTHPIRFILLPTADELAALVRSFVRSFVLAPAHFKLSRLCVYALLAAAILLVRTYVRIDMYVRTHVRASTPLSGVQL